MANRKSARATPRLSREEWLARALEVIGREGRGWIGIHELVELVGVTKGSFYWHFEGRRDFVEALLDYWDTISTKHIAEAVLAKGGSAEGRLLALAQGIVSGRLTQFDLAIRVWALREPIVSEALAKVDGFRYKYVKGLFREIGFRGKELEMRSCTFLAYYSFEGALAAIATDMKRSKQLVELRHQMLIRQP